MSKIITVRTSGVAPHIPVIEPLSITENGTYTAPSGVDGYSPVTVDVQPNLGTKNITQNGTYTASSDNLDGYSSVTVDVQEQPWQPLEDGYSNFWFELTNDTLSPWLNFSSKNADAVIDWGDGSGEVALDTLTPTHTYAKAGKYVVKVKGVTGIAQQHITPCQGRYTQTLKYAELNNEVTALTNSAFAYAMGLKKISYSATALETSGFNTAGVITMDVPEGTTGLPSSFLNHCTALESLTLPSTLTSIQAQSIYFCVSLQTITIPSRVTTIANSALSTCISLSEIHVQATTPPTLSSSVFSNLPSDYIIYVPVGTGDTYKADAGWSAYADHIVEEGQTLSEAALRRIQAEERGEASPTDEDMR